jgi:hypothetical protein
MFDRTKDWNKALRPEEILKKDGREYVFLRGLERLAKERGISEATSRILATPSPESPCAVVTYGFRFYDGGYYEGSADATINNCDKGFRLYLTAMAESRAKARALRTAFGISLCSVEEIAAEPVEEDETQVSANDQQKFLIKHLATKGNIPMTEVLKSANVENIDDLTKSEAKGLIATLNKPRRKK